METQTEIKTLCENIKRIRKREGLSKTAMAKKLGIGIKSLEKIESGILPERLGCQVLGNIYFHFGIAPKTLFTTIL